MAETHLAKSAKAIMSSRRPFASALSDTWHRRWLFIIFFQAFEDFEFSQMEEEARRESEREELSKEIV
jgi:hypothetical protein